MVVRDFRKQVVALVFEKAKPFLGSVIPANNHIGQSVHLLKSITSAEPSARPGNAIPDQERCYPVVVYSLVK